MELLQTENYYILNKNQDSLWFNRKTGEHECKTCWDLASAKTPVCLGIVHALIGKFQIFPDMAQRLVLVSGVKEVGTLTSSDGKPSVVFCITRILFLPLNAPLDVEFNLQPCHKHHTHHPHSISQDRKNLLPFGDFQPKVGLSKTFGTIRNVTSSIKSATVNAAVNATGQNKSKKDFRDKEKFERRILDELTKMFNESESFFYCQDYDITSSLQRQNETSYNKSLPLWKRADDRFFWNKHMLQDFMSDDHRIPDCWFTPVIQGFIQIESVPLQIEGGHNSPEPTEGQNGISESHYILILISRRSRRRAGTRYKRRGVDEEGHVANYVETEQIIRFSHHQVAFVQIRGSVPLFWSQPGYKYRPPPRLDKGTEETASAFKKHFEHELEKYKKVTCISLVEQSGKEKVIADAFLDHVMIFNSPLITFISFDFHEYCRGMRYENVAVLIEGIEDVINSMLYCWVDKEGVICRQNGIFRVNCIDCLDRTNVVQTALGRTVLENQFAKLGIIPPEHTLPQECRVKLQMMWANNGDTISKQYAGTSALKGDFTRTGERNFAGLMKDGMNSANRYFASHFQDTYRQAAIDILHYGHLTRDCFEEINYLETLGNVASALAPVGPPQYMSDIALGPEKELANAVYSLSRYYLNRFKDAYRQATIDTMLGVPVSEDLLNLNPDMGVGEEEDSALAQHVKHVIDDCKKMLVPDAQTILGAWGLIDADPTSGDPEQTDMDIILVLTRDSYYVAQYDEEADRILHFVRISLIDLDKVEYGPYTFQGMFKQSRTHYCIRFNYQEDGQAGFYHMFRSMNIRFFNNMAVNIKTEEEIIESIKAIGDTFEVAAEMIGCEVELCRGKLEKKKKRGKSLGSNPFLLLSPIATFTKNSPDTLKSVGTRAFSNVTSGLAKLNPISTLRTKRVENRQPIGRSSQFYTQQPTVSIVARSHSKVLSREYHLQCCGIISSSVSPPPGVSCFTSPPFSRSLSENILHQNYQSSNVNNIHFRPLTPEILVSGDISSAAVLKTVALDSSHSHHLLSAGSERVRKLSHSSDDVDSAREDESEEANIQRASSSSELNLQLPLQSSSSEGRSFAGVFRSSLNRTSAQLTSPLSPLSPLSNINKETVLAPFSVLAKGVQSLAPGAGKLAKGVQNIGANLDPRKLKIQRQKELEENMELKTRKLKCKSRIIQF
ncbi:UNVERIFIED_CONTAM: hypothetical protein RMT77_002292 [Armadillidium vulgare]